MAIEDIPRTIWWQEDEAGGPAVYLVDQSRLPLVGDLLVCTVHEGICMAISGMAVRGAPALGVAAAMAIALWAANESDDLDETGAFLAELDSVAAEVAGTRPTAVNLAWGAERVRRLAHDNADLPLGELRQLIIDEALAMAQEDEARNRLIGSHGAELLPEECRVLTHCNAGSLATAFFGTALGVIFTAHAQGKIAGVWVDETRPVLQGARLTAWELMVAGVPFRLIVDSVAASVMRAGMVDAVIVGADRIAANGDVANKIGTYGLAVLCKEHGIPFYVAAPTSTVDLTLASGDEMVIELRDPREIEGVTFSGVVEPESPVETHALDMLTEDGPYTMSITKGHALQMTRKGAAYQVDGWARIAPPNVEVYNPAFDVTPAEYVTAIITECGACRGPYGESLAGTCEGSGAIHEL
ncbi:MAG TPA: S-methyl-5-thioribose-1-phosphate isomerase [Coriobacteriia bacterium]